MKCLNCGKEFKQIEKTSKFCCKKCLSEYISRNGSFQRSKNYDNIRKVTKEKIIELYSSGKSFTGSAKELNITRNSLSRLCRSFNLDF